MLQFDFFANELAVGDMVVFPRRLKNGKLALGSLTIYEIRPDALLGVGLTGRKMTIRQATIDRCAKVQGLSEPSRRRQPHFR